MAQGTTPAWLKRLRLLGVVLPVLAIIAFQLARPAVAEWLGAERADVVITVASIVAVALFGIGMLWLIERGYRVVTRQSEELAAAHDAMVEQARHLARVDELDRIARELHDSLAQALGTLHLRLRALQSGPDPLAPAAAQEVDDLADLAHGAYVDVREAILGLRSLTGDELPLATAVARYATNYQRLGGPHTDVTVDPDLSPLDPASRLHVLRIVQEALANTRRHAHATHAEVRIRRVDGEIEVIVSDDGAGFSPGSTTGPTGGFGLDSMRERAALVGGRFHLESSPGAGTSVRLAIPDTMQAGATP